MKQKIPRLLIAGTNSGCGKTTIVCGILSAFKLLKRNCASCKCGPDYIDPMFHSRVLGIPSQNLDLFFTTEEQTRYLLAKHGKGKDVTLMEGVMGFYDGMQMDSPKASSYHLARATQTPTVLVVNCRGMALSTVAVIKGFLEFREDHTICGVILNGVSPMVGEQLTKVIEEQLKIRVYGCVPKLEDFSLASRHLGLITPYELSDIQQSLDNLGRKMGEYIDMEGLLQLAEQAVELDDRMPVEWGKLIYSKVGEGLTIGVARDKAFCFYYKENLELLEALGCKLVSFSPLEDGQVPQEADAVLLGGGYPEVYASELSSNEGMRRSLKERMEQGLFCIAECGGFMYLHEQLEDEKGKMYPMVGAIKGECRKQGKLVRFGYVNVEWKGQQIKAHEFHYWDSTNNGEEMIARKPSGKRQWSCCHLKQGLMGYPHFYYYSNIEFVIEILNRMQKGLKEG